MGGGGYCGVRLHCQDAMTQLAEAVMVTHMHAHSHRSLYESRKTVTTHINVIYSTYITTKQPISNAHIHTRTGQHQNPRLITLSSSLR